MIYILDQVLSPKNTHHSDLPVEKKYSIFFYNCWNFKLNFTAYLATTHETQQRV